MNIKAPILTWWWACPVKRCCLTAITHMQAKVDGLTAPEHAAHDAFHYDEGEVKRAVNKRKQALRRKHGNLPSLREET